MSEVIYTSHFHSAKDALKHNPCMWLPILEKCVHLDSKGVCKFAYPLREEETLNNLIKNLCSTSANTPQLLFKENL